MTGKNGVYFKLVNNVREAFEECELVRVNCQGLNKVTIERLEQN
jgi:RNA-binding protein YhbY